MDDWEDISMSLSYSMSYKYSDQDESPTADSTSPTIKTEPTSAPVSVPEGPTSAPASAPVEAPTPETEPETEAETEQTDPPLPTCFDMEPQTLENRMFVETRRSSLDFPLLENILSDLMRDRLPMCEDVTARRKLQELDEIFSVNEEESDFGYMRGLQQDEVDRTSSEYYIGNVDLVPDEEECKLRHCAESCRAFWKCRFWAGLTFDLLVKKTFAPTVTCDPSQDGLNCFVAELTLRLFGNVTESEIERILQIARELLSVAGMEEEEKTDSLIDVDGDNTATDAPPKENSSQESEAEGLTPLAKGLIGAIGGCVAVALLVFLLKQRSISNDTEKGLDDEDFDEYNPPKPDENETMI